ncbi:MAG: alpha/beta hydrolase [Bdellovibrionales bacterium]|nr:alpha/beta hydrolase [Ramlibacter sp.]
MTRSTIRILTLPGWENSGPLHWQSVWEREFGYERVEQHDFMRPLRGDWIARLEDVLLADERPTVLVAHSLSCILTAAWAAASRNTHRVKAALLVAPGDVEREAIRPQLPSWSPIPLQKLPFQSVLLGSRNDPFCDIERSRLMADAWGSRFIDCGAAGHINAESGLGDWPQGQALLTELLKD